jgi:hypothetical protein
MSRAKRVACMQGSFEESEGKRLLGRLRDGWGISGSQINWVGGCLLDSSGSGNQTPASM